MCAKNVRVKGGIITISVTEKFIEDVEAFNRLFQGESDRCLVESRQEGKWTHYRLSEEGRRQAVALLLDLTTPGS